MKLIESLRNEHALIEQALGSLRAYVDRRLDGSAGPADGRPFVEFFTSFAGHYHHDREERVLFPALVHEAELPGDRGPIAALLHDHEEMAAWLAEMAPLLVRSRLTEDEGSTLRDLAVKYSQALWRHIDAENSVLLPQGEERLRRRGVRDLADRAMTEAEEAARAGVMALLARYPAVEDPTLIRGDGCVACRAYGDTCEGLEIEWWTELEWEEADRDGDG